MIENSDFELSCLFIHIIEGIFSLLGVSDIGEQLLVHLVLCLVHALIKILIIRLTSHKILIHTKLLCSVSSSLFFLLKLLSTFLPPEISLLQISFATHFFLLHVGLLLDIDGL